MIRAALIGAVAVAVPSAALAAPAHADGLDQTSNDGGGFRVAVSVTVNNVKGNVVKPGVHVVSVPPKCWWELYNAEIGGKDMTTPEGFKEFYDESVPLLTGHAAAGRLSMPSKQEVDRVAAEGAAGKKYRWYWLRCRDGVNGAAEGYTRSGGAYYGVNVPVAHRAFLDGQVPPPLVAIREVAVSLWDEAQKNLHNPTIDRNPKIAANGGATLVRVPTWFWVTNPAAALADNGQISLHAVIPGTQVQMTLNASSSGVALTSPAGSAECSVPAAKYTYGSGKSQANACTIAFQKSNAGWPVTATIDWAGAWTGTDADGTPDGDTVGAHRETTVIVPVVESQAVGR